MSNASAEIRLIARSGTTDQEGVRFYVTPEFNEQRGLIYEEMSDIRAPGGYVIYLGTQPRTYSITARMVSRTEEEADRTYRYTHRLKSWTVPRKGTASEDRNGGENTPEVLKLWGYGGSSRGGQIRGVPVVLTSLGIDFPQNVTYIQTSSKKAYVPIIQTFTIQLKEARNLDELTEAGGFNLEAFKKGNLPEW